YELAKQVGEYVGWCGIVRGNEFDTASATTRLLVEHKYFDGLTDLHQQIVSIYGAGDFHVVLPGKVTADEVPPLCLVRVYGTMFNDEAGRPTLNADYVRVWPWGVFAFMDYGTD